MLQHIPYYPGDPILSLMEAYQTDARPHKVSLSIGIYFDAQGRIPLMESVRAAEQAVMQNAGARSYLPIEGLPEYRSEVQKLVFGANSPALQGGRVVTVQGVGSSGGLRLGADFIKRFFPASQVWLSNPSWENHTGMFESAGLTTHTYPYYDATTGGVDLAGMLAKLDTLPAHSVVLLHASCHNPTGVDLTPEQWPQVIAALKARQLIPFVDLAYQGFGDGLDEDAAPVRALAESGLLVLVANSFSKNFSLYGERCGALSVVCPPSARLKEDTQSVLSQLKLLVRGNYSSPPLHGARLIAKVLSSPELRAQWAAELTEMRGRIHGMRQALHTALKKRTAHNFDFLLTQRGMFSYTGLSEAQVNRLREEFAVYLVRSGRLCITGLQAGNVDYVADSIVKVL